MNDNPIQSNLPEFGHLPSTGILRQQPPSSKQIAKSNKRAKAKVWVQNLFAAVVLFGTVGSATLTMKSCSKDSDRQAVEAVKFQAQVGGTR